MTKKEKPRNKRKIVEKAIHVNKSSFDNRTGMEKWKKGEQ